jgi:hypothetical protein
MGSQDSDLGKHEMNRKTTNKEKKAYRSPRLVVYGDLRHLTMGAHGTRRDGPSGSPKSRAFGAQ